MKLILTQGFFLGDPKYDGSVPSYPRNFRITFFRFNFHFWFVFDANFLLDKGEYRKENAIVFASFCVGWLVVLALSRKNHFKSFNFLLIDSVYFLEIDSKIQWRHKILLAIVTKKNSERVLKSLDLVNLKFLNEVKSRKRWKNEKNWIYRNMFEN